MTEQYLSADYDEQKALTLEPDDDQPKELEEDDGLEPDKKPGEEDLDEDDLGEDKDEDDDEEEEEEVIQ